ncbi:GNAT family N-acetyltransferase [Nonomuraea sp. NN258]|uniref:GNAT family N-acetyltransferase n=1 Tax=Nonomuraea antri TaxID=2730852 RepID=UPI001569B89D|nr:GNAT family protein [Nonomuraea antri]NRQ31672.1 GNAT family N-acetyltransferase [Nonomuraea antri]
MLFPHVKTRRTALCPPAVEPGHSVYGLLQEAGVGDLPAPEVFTSLHASDTVAEFLVQRCDTGRTVGYASLHHLDQAAQHVQASVVGGPASDLDPPAAKAINGLLTEATMLIVNYAFAMWNLRKIYFWTVGVSLEAHRATLQAVPEATLSDFVHQQGQLLDVHISALYRHKWEKDGPTLLRRLVLDPAARRRVEELEPFGQPVALSGTSEGNASS